MLQLPSFWHGTEEQTSYAESQVSPPKPSAQLQAKPSANPAQTPPLAQGASAHVSTISSQLSPAQPGEHAQAYDNRALSMHVAPLRQGPDPHSDVSSAQL